MQIWSKKNLTGAGALIISFMVANLLNFAFNAFLGRSLSYEQFGLLTFYNTILYLVAIFFGALSSSINHRTAYLNGKYNHEAGALFTKHVRKIGYVVGIGLVLAWLVFTPLTAKLFQIDNLFSLFLFSPIFLVGLVAYINRGFLQGNLYFLSVALVVLSEALFKLLVAAALVFLGHQELVYLSLPASLLAAFGVSMFLIRFRNQPVEGKNAFRFPKRFYAASVITGLSSAVFLSVDVIMAKHYLNPDLAGQYAMLSLVGKMVYFLGSLLNGLMITFVSHDIGERKNTIYTFYKLFSAAFVLTVLGTIFFGVFGDFTIPLLLGDKVIPILPYLTIYALAIGLFTLASVIITYHLALEQYVFSFGALAVSVIMAVGITFKHHNIPDFINVILWCGIISIVLMLILHFVQRNGKFVLANLISLISIFKPLPLLSELREGGKRILIMNWRDLRHSQAGGAEVYVHELAKRWVRDGNQVTLFCGNDGRCPHNEIIDGVRIVRRGGFHLVYFWAFIYYLSRFRGRFDLIIDVHNGIPFFTPMYAQEKVYGVMFHVHQRVFFKYLPKPLAWFASVLENRAMPYIYRNVKFLTISESTKKDMENMDLKGAGIEVVFPGVDLSQMLAGQKSPEPTVLYLGRLKAYKSVDILIKAFQEIIKTSKNAKLLIAGNGEEELNLKKLVESLRLSASVKFLGKVTEAQKITLMQQAWVFVNPSLMEGWGITTIEASACGTPVVASDVPGLRDSVKNQHTGFLVTYGDVNAFAEKISLLLKDRDLRVEITNNAQEWARNFDWDISSKKFIKNLNLNPANSNPTANGATAQIQEPII